MPGAVLVVEAGFRWDAFVGANANASLFGDRKVVDLRIPSGKPGVDGGKNKYMSPVMFAIWNALKEAQIEMPYPQRVVHMKAPASA